jgi:predicted enzyme related to lactoylglutathione lyase
MADAMGFGKFIWNELATPDAARCEQFYTQLFGWTAETTPMGPSRYTYFKQDGNNVGGMLQMTAEWAGIRPHWMPYVHVTDVDATARRITELGGKVCVPPSDIPVGRFAVVEDPTGGTFSIIKMKQ